ncbi:MAG: hypothetical protein D6785_08025, partial [Planctomycetota bacterium]
RWTDSTKAVMDNDKIKIEGAVLENQEIIDAVSKTEADRLRQTWRDLVIGMFTQPGYISEWVPSGSMRSVTVQFSTQRGLETIFNMTERPPARDLFTLLPQSVRKVLYKMISLEAQS